MKTRGGFGMGFFRYLGFFALGILIPVIRDFFQSRDSGFLWVSLHTRDGFSRAGIFFSWDGISRRKANSDENFHEKAEVHFYALQSNGRTQLKKEDIPEFSVQHNLWNF